MIWEWSHTKEAYENAYRNLQTFSLNILQEIWCEIQTYQDIESEDVCLDWDDKVYYQHLSRVADQHDLLVDWIWEWGSEWRQCDNGGSRLNLCPYGCHTVSVDNEEVEKND